MKNQKERPDGNVRFDEQVVLVTGAGRGLGAAYARLIASRGGTVIVHDAGVERDGSGGDPEPALNMAKSIKEKGGIAEAEVQNLASQKGCEDLVNAVMQRHGKIDALVHSAGIVRYNRIAETSPEEWKRMLDINVSAAWWLCRSVWPGMIRRGYGRIVLTLSGFALRVIPGADVTGYSLGKGAQFGLMNALASEGEEHGISVNGISPVAATRIFRANVGPNELTPESIAPGAALLASSHCPSTGKVLVAEGGQFAVDTMQRGEITNLGSAAEPAEVLQLFV